MSDDQKPKAPKLAGAQIARFIVGSILFGVLMGLRGELASIWVRMLVAACAGAVLGACVLPIWRRKR